MGWSKIATARRTFGAFSGASSRTAAAADGTEHLAGGVTGFVGREQNVYRGEFRGLAGTTHRRVGAEFGKLVRELSAAYGCGWISAAFHGTPHSVETFFA